MKADARVLNLILTHQPADAVEKTLVWWVNNAGVSAENILVAYGGNAAEFAKIQHPQTVFIEDLRLKTRDHQREAQSYSGVFREAVRWMNSRGTAEDDFTHVYFSEYDQLPLIADLNRRQLAALAEENADLLGLRLTRVDETSHPHFLYHAKNPEFAYFWRQITHRTTEEARSAVLTMFGTGSFWTRAAFTAVAGLAEPFPIYLELFLPTAAHHLGFRVRPYPDEKAREYIDHLKDFSSKINEARVRGAWTIHPVKQLPATI